MADLSQTLNPVLVNVVRGESVESCHRGSVAIVSHSGELLAKLGDIASPIYPRSAIKPLQTLLLASSSAITNYRLGSKELALASASHSGEAIHTQLAESWLEKIDLSVTDLECGAHPPYDKQRKKELLLGDQTISALHNNCSGKHLGLLTVCKAMGIDHHGYCDAMHPVQKKLTALLAELYSYQLAKDSYGIDGCSIPVYPVPLRNIALAFARLTKPKRLGASRLAAEKTLSAILQWPQYVAGSERFCTQVMLAGNGGIITKTGAEGVYTAALLNAGIGIALKVDDGASRASEVAMATILCKLLSEVSEELQNRANLKLLNANQLTVGRILGSQALNEALTDSRLKMN